MKKKLVLFICFFLLCVIHVFAELRTFDEIFPNLKPDVRNTVFEEGGYIKYNEKKSGFQLFGDSGNVAVGIASQIVNKVLESDPVYLVECLSVLQGKPGDVSLLDIYNALQNIRDLKGRLYNSATRNQAVPLFEEATRLKSEKQATAIDDPPPSKTVPARETIFIRLKDANFGNSYYKGELALIQNGLCYSLSNFKSLSYFFIPVIKEGKFVAQFYFEPINEGILIYSIAGADISDFFSSKIHMNSAIAKRLSVITSWAVEGITKKK